MPDISLTIDFLRQKYYYMDQELVPESGVIEDGDGALNFNDLKRSTLYTPKYSFATGGLSRSRWKKIVVGGAPLCPCCGRYDVTYNDALVCENCLDNYADNRNYIICDDCGARVHIDDSYWVMKLKPESAVHVMRVIMVDAIAAEMFMI